MVRYAAPLVPGPRHRRHDHQPDQTIDRHEAVRAPQGTSGSAAGRTTYETHQIGTPSSLGPKSGSPDGPSGVRHRDRDLIRHPGGPDHESLVATADVRLPMPPPLRRVATLHGDAHHDDPCKVSGGRPCNLRCISTNGC